MLGSQFSSQSTNHSDIKFANKTHHYSKNHLTNLASKWSILHEDPVGSECCSPNSELKEAANCSQKLRFAAKDSNESLEGLNQNMASKVKLKSRNEILQEERNVRK